MLNSVPRSLQIPRRKLCSGYRLDRTPYQRWRRTSCRRLGRCVLPVVPSPPPCRAHQQTLQIPFSKPTPLSGAIDARLSVQFFLARLTSHRAIAHSHRDLRVQSWMLVDQRESFTFFVSADTQTLPGGNRGQVIESVTLRGIFQIKAFGDEVPLLAACVVCIDKV